MMHAMRNNHEERNRRNPQEKGGDMMTMMTRRVKLWIPVAVAVH